MTQDRTHYLPLNGITMIRLMLATYFIFVALNLIEGISPASVFHLIDFPPMADTVGPVVLFSLALWFMTGLYLRGAALSLAGFVLSASISHQIMVVGLEDLSALWRDLALVCAVLLSYASLSVREIEDVAMVQTRRREQLPNLLARIAREAHQSVRPNRVPAGMAQTPRPSVAPGPVRKLRSVPEDDVVNIFTD